MLYAGVLAAILLLGFLMNHTKGSLAKRQKAFLRISFLILALMSACRYEAVITSDMYRNYIHMVEARYTEWSEVFTFSEEFLHGVLRKTLITVFNDPQSYFFVTAAFITGAVFVTIRRFSPDLLLSIVMYYTLGGYFGSNNITRQYIAIAFCLLAARYIVQEKPGKFLIFLLLAIGFHTSALIMVPLYLLSKRRFSRNTLIGYLALTVPLLVFNRQITAFIQRYFYTAYGGGYGAESSNPLRLIWPALVVVGLILIKLSGHQCTVPMVEGKPRQTQIYNNLLSHGAIMYVYFSLMSAVNMLMFSRVASFFQIYGHIVLIFGVRSLSKKRDRKLIVMGLVVLIIAWFLYNDFTGRLIPTPYTPFWEFPDRRLV